MVVPISSREEFEEKVNVCEEFTPAPGPFDRLATYEKRGFYSSLTTVFPIGAALPFPTSLPPAPDQTRRGWLGRSCSFTWSAFARVPRECSLEEAEARDSSFAVVRDSASRPSIAALTMSGSPEGVDETRSSVLAASWLSRLLERVLMGLAISAESMLKYVLVFYFESVAVRRSTDNS